MSELIEKILRPANIKTAKEKVYANKGAGGVDGKGTVMKNSSKTCQSIQNLSYYR